MSSEAPPEKPIWRQFLYTAFSLILLGLAGASLWWVFAPGFNGSPVDGDDLGTSIAVLQRSRDFSAAPDQGYNYHFQNGAINVAAVFSRLTLKSAFRSYYLVSYFSAITASVLFGIYAARAAQIPIGLGIISALLLPETFMVGYYANANTLAAVFGGIALLSAQRNPSFLNALISGVFLGFAAWSRCDAVLLAPALAFHLFLGQPGRFVTGFFKAALCCVASLGSIMGLLYLGSSSLQAIYAQVDKHESHFVIWESLLCQSYFFPVITSLLILIGIWELVRRREYSILIPAAVGFLSLYLPFARLLVTPKYFYYAIPFLAAFAANGFRGVWNVKPILLRVFLLLAILASIAQLAGSYFPAEETRPARVDWSVNNRVNTHDGPRFITGTWQIPKWFADNHGRIRREVKRFDQLIAEIAREQRPATIHRIFGSWIGYNSAVYHLLSNGFRCDKPASKYDSSGLPAEIDFVNDKTRVTLVVHKDVKEVVTSRSLTEKDRRLLLIGGFRLDTTGLSIEKQIAGTEHPEYKVFLLKPEQ